MLLRRIIHSRKQLLSICILLILACSDKEVDTSPPVMVLPVTDVDDFLYIGRIYSSTISSPIGVVHHGLDFFPDGDLKSFQSVFDGVVTRIDLFENEIMGTWQVNVHIEYNDAYGANYAFEPFSTNQSDGQIQRDNIQVQKDQHVTARQIIGQLYAPHPSAHVHFSLFNYNEIICPESYWTEEARNEIMELIHAYNPEWDMCY